MLQRLLSPVSLEKGFFPIDLVVGEGLEKLHPEPVA